MAEFNLINRTQTMLHYLFDIADKAPKKLRTNFLSEFRNCGCRTLEYIITANNYPLDKNNPEFFQTRREYQIKAKAMLQTIDSYAEMGVQHSYFTLHQMETLTKLTFDCQNTLNKWIASDDNRMK